MQSDKRETTANLLDNGVAPFGRRGWNPRPVANHANPIRRHTFRHDSLAHVFAEYDYTSGSAKSAAMQLFPAVCPGTALDDFAANRHIGIEVANVVHEWTASHARDEGAC